MSKQTAVEWFWNQLPDILPFSLDTETAVKLQEAKEQAKAMEQEQIVEAWCDEVPRLVFGLKAEKYYEHTYGKEASHEG